MFYIYYGLNSLDIENIPEKRQKRRQFRLYDIINPRKKNLRTKLIALANQKAKHEFFGDFAVFPL